MLLRDTLPCCFACGSSFPRGFPGPRPGKARVSKHERQANERVPKVCESNRDALRNLPRASAGLNAVQRQTQPVDRTADRTAGSFRPGSSVATHAEQCSSRRQRLTQQSLQTDAVGPRSPIPQVEAGRQRQRDQRQRDHRQGRGFSLEADFPRHSAGRCNVVCPHCQAHHWRSERTAGTNTQPLFGMCCHAGAVQLPALGPTPAVLADLLSAQTSRGRAFRENIRRYNVSLAMASSGSKACFAFVQCNAVQC